MTTVFQKVTQTFDRDLIIVANAGAGKTELLVKHYFELLAHGYDPASIIAFTFTEKAASELRERILKEIFHHPSFSELPEEILQELRKKIFAASIGTIHQFCLQVIEADRSPEQRIPFKIIDESLELHLENQTIKKKLRQFFNDQTPEALLGLKTYGVRNLSKLLSQWLTRKQQETSTQLEPPEMIPEEKESFESLERMGLEIQTEITQHKNAKGWLSFQDIETLALQKISNPTASLRNYLNRFSHLLVDEFQDTSPIQITILETLRAALQGSKKNLRLFCVGDPKQSIYRFRQVDVKLIERTEKKILEAGGERFYFSENYRSTPAILKLVNQFSDSAFPDSQPSQHTRDDTEDSHAVLIPIDGEGNAEVLNHLEAIQAADEIAQLQRKEVPLDQIAVLFRASASAIPLAKELKKRGIPYTLRGGQNLFERQEIIDLKRLLFFLADPQDDLSLVGLLRSPLFLISDATLFFLSLQKRDSSLFAFLLDKELESVSLPISEEKEKLVWVIHHLKNWQQMSQTVPPSTLLRTILATLDLESIYQSAYEDEGYPLAMEQWLEWVETLEEENAPWSLKELVQLLKELKNNQAIKTPLGEMIAVKNAVQLLTIHAAKGLQFDTVMLIGLNRRPPISATKIQSIGNHFALKILDEKGEEFKTPRFIAMENYHAQEESEENKRLLYVAMTRAKNRLKIFYQPKEKSNQSLQSILFKNLAGKVEEFLQNRKGEAMLRLPLQPTTSAALSKPRSLPFLKREEKIPSDFSVSELETYHQCPLKHFLAYHQQISDSNWEEPSSLSSTEIGTILHQCIQAHRLQPGLSPLPLIERTIKNSHNHVPNELIQELSSNLNQYLESEAFAEILSAQEDFSELPFYLKLAGGQVRGQIDRLIYSEQGWTLIDFKYALKQHTKSALLKNYGFQLKTYALAAESILKTSLNSVKIHLLHDSNTFTFQFSPEELSSHRDLLENLIKTIQRQTFDPMQIEWREACPPCGFNRNIPLCTVPQGKPFSSGIFSM